MRMGLFNLHLLFMSFMALAAVRFTAQRQTLLYLQHPKNIYNIKIHVSEGRPPPALMPYTQLHCLLTHATILRCLEHVF